MSKNIRKIIKSLLFKPYKFNNNGNISLIIIYKHDSFLTRKIGIKGKKTTNKIESISIIDIDKTIETGSFFTDNWQIVNIDEFLTYIEPADISEFSEEIHVALSVIMEEIAIMSSRMSMMEDALSSIRHVINESPTKQGEIIIADNNDYIAEIAFKTITGNMEKLSKDNISKMGNIVLEVITNNSHLDVSDNSNVGKIKAEIEYKIIDSLPNTMRAEDVSINMEPILSEIKRIQSDFSD